MSASLGSGAKSQKTLADLDLEEEDAILKRMEEILMTYKSRVETHLGTHLSFFSVFPKRAPASQLDRRAIH